MKAQKYNVHISTNDLPYDGYNPIGGAVYKPFKKKSLLIGFISGWDIQTDTAVVTLFEAINLTFLIKGGIITKSDIILKKMTNDELRKDIEQSIKIPFAEWAVLATK